MTEIPKRPELSKDERGRPRGYASWESYFEHKEVHEHAVAKRAVKALTASRCDCITTKNTRTLEF